VQYGLDLNELAEVMIQFGVLHAINVDGGGSTVAVYQGRVISVPTCADTPVVCERAVTSIACVRQPKNLLIQQKED
jgi:exopolysaccharide biosynthesis protein